MGDDKAATFSPSWEPSLIREEVVAEGQWWYEDEIPVRAILIRRTYDYTSFDIASLERILCPAHKDYLEYNMSDDGVLYSWQFDGRDSGSTFSSYFPAREHIGLYGRKFNIKWLLE